MILKKVSHHFLFSVLFLLVISIFLNFLPLHLTEPDNIFHIASSSLYRDYGIFFNDFHWENFSVFKTYKSDIWYGFHLLLSLFIFKQKYLLAIQLAGAFLTFIFLSSFYLLLKKFNIKYPLIWTLILLVSSSNELLRYIDLRPHIIIATLTIALVYVLVSKKEWYYLFLATLLFSFFEISMIWLPICITGLYFLSVLIGDFIENKRQNLLPIIKSGVVTFCVVILGLIVGGMLRPNPFDGFYLFYYQIVYLYLLKFHSVAFPYVSELYPIDKNTFLSITPLIFGFVVSFFVWVLNRSKKIEKYYSEILYFSFVSSIFFLGITIFSSIRAIDFFTLFVFIFISLVWEKYNEIIPLQIKKNLLFKVAPFIFVFCVAYSSVLSVVFYRLNYGTTLEKYKNAAEFLKNNTKEGAVVANLTFDDYPGLFIWNRHNVYMNHSDIVFQYAYDEEVMNEYFCAISRLSSIKDVFGPLIDAKKLASDCKKEKDKDLIEIFAIDMGADYVFIGENHPFGVIKFLTYEKKLKPVYVDQNSLIFKIK